MSTTFWILATAMTLLALSIPARAFIGAGRTRTFIALALAMPLGAVLLYQSLGAPDLAVAAPATEGHPQPAPVQGRQKVGSVASMTDGLAARLSENPDDGKGWLLLARSYKHLGRMDDARDAYAKALALGVSDPDMDALAGAGSGAGSGAGTGAAAVGVAGQVRISDAAREIVQPGDTVFIFARAPGQGGAPAAVMKTTAKNWPIDFRLTDAESMVAGMRLSDLQEVVVTVRVSRAGTAGDALQGLEAKSPVIAVRGDEPVDLLIE